MRRHAYGFLASGTVLYAASALQVMGSWAAVTAVLLLITGALVLAVAMEGTPARTSLATPAELASNAGPDLVA